jgi:C1A family cysteine protease
MKTIRRYGWSRDTDTDRLALGHPYRATRFKAVQFPASFDLNVPSNPAFSLLDQGQLGACTAFALKRCVWYGLVAAGNSFEPSALYQYQSELTLDGDFGQDNGSTISQGITAALTDGLPPESEWPYNVANFTVHAPPQVVADALKFEALGTENINVDANLAANLQDCLFNQRLPVAFGSLLFPQFESDQCAQDGIVQMPPAGATEIGGHAQCIRGWRVDAQGLLWFKVNNSWNTWGDNTCDWMSIDYLLAYASDFHAITKMA